MNCPCVCVVCVCVCVCTILEFEFGSNPPSEIISLFPFPLCHSSIQKLALCRVAGWSERDFFALWRSWNVLLHPSVLLLLKNFRSYYQFEKCYNFGARKHLDRAT